MANADQESARAVIAELERIASMMEELSAALGERRSFTPEESNDLRDRLKLLKNRLERGANYGTTDGIKRQLSESERLYFDPAVRKAKAFLGINLNSRPGPEWVSKLHGASMDITHPLAELKNALGA